MDNSVTKILDELNEEDIVLSLKKIKEKIKRDETAKALIDKFIESKKLYEEYGYNKDFIQDKINLMENKLIKKYLEIQNEINLLSVYINKKIEEITKNTTCTK